MDSLFTVLEGKTDYSAKASNFVLCFIIIYINRFYFLSNDELLEILAETKDPLRVQPFCKKIFEGIHRLQFEDNLDISAMFSEEGEKVEFIKVFNPKDAQGAVEKWLIQATLILGYSFLYKVAS